MIFVYFVSYTFLRPGLGHGFGSSRVPMDREVASWEDIATMRGELMRRESLADAPVVILFYQLLAAEPGRRPVL